MGQWGPCPPPPEGQGNTNLSPQASRTFRWGPGSARWRVTSAWLHYGVAGPLEGEQAGPPSLGTRSKPQKNRAWVKGSSSHR